MNLVSAPGAINFSGNLPKVILNAGPAEIIDVTLKKGGSIVLEELYYPDAAGRIEIDYEKVIDRLLKVNTPFFQGVVFAQAEAHATFDIVLTSTGGGNTTLSFKVIKGGVGGMLPDQEIFIKSNFLTWQLQSKEIKFHDPEFLTYYSANASKVVVKGYFENGNSQTVDLANLAAGALVSINVNYGQVSSVLGANPLYYDVWVEIGGTRLTYIQRYILTSKVTDFDNLFVFENSLGGIDTIRFTGEIEEKNLSEFSTAVFDEVVLEYDIKVEKSYTVNSGFFKSDRQRRWAVEFINSSQKYFLSEGTFSRVFSNKPEISSIPGELSSFEVDFILSKQEKYLNLNRSDQQLPNLQIDTQLGEVFFLAPRLNELPWANDPDALIPVQYPFENFWRKISLPSLVSSVKGSFSEYVDHPVKTTSDVRHKSIQSTNFVSGATGSGWQIDKDGDATFDNLTVRKSFNVFELVLNKLSATNGALAITDSIKIASVEETETEYECYIDTDEDSIYVPFRVDDLLRCQVWNGKSQKYYFVKVNFVGDGYFTVDKTTKVGAGIPAAGDAVVRFGNLTDLDRQGLIYLTSSDDNSPYIDILDGVNSADLSGKTIGRFGRLDGIVDPVFGPLSGNGIYLNKAYIVDAIFSGTIRSIDGRSFINLNDNEIMFASDESSFDVNVTNPGAITFQGVVIQRPGVGSFPMPVDRGPYVPGAYYFHGDRVFFNGSTWTYIYPTPSKDNPPKENSYWTISAVKGNNGARILFRTSDSSSIPPPYSPLDKNQPGWSVNQQPTTGGGEAITVGAGDNVTVDTSYLTTNLNLPWLWSITEELKADGTFLKWGAPIRITPIDGVNPDYTELRFRKGSSPTIAPEIDREANEPDGWSLLVPELGILDYLWKSYGKKSGAGELQAPWSLPIRDTAIQGAPGTPGTDGYSVSLEVENVVLSANEIGAVIPEELARAKTIVYAFRGSTALASVNTGTANNGQFQLVLYSAEGCTAELVNNKSGVRLTSMASDIAMVTLIISLEGKLTLIKTFKITKSRSGMPGLPGDNGAAGQTSYVHIRYSNDSGLTFTPDGGTSTGNYLGQLVNFNPVASTNPADYAWKKIKGETGPIPTGGDVYDPNKYYTGSDLRVEIVRYNGGTGELVYVARTDAGTFKDVLPTDTSKWNPFGGVYDMLATKLFFAQLALVKNLAVENLFTNVAPFKRFEVSNSENNITHFAEGNQKIAEWDDDSALSDDFYYIDLQENVSNTLFFGINRTADYSVYNAGSYNSKKGTQDNFANGFPRGYSGIKFFVSGTVYRYLFREMAYGIKFGDPDNEYNLFGSTTVGKNSVITDSLISRGAFASGIKTITDNYILDTQEGASPGRDHSLFYRGAANISVKLTTPTDNGSTIPTASNLNNMNLGREIKIINKGTGSITAYSGDLGRIITGTGAGVDSFTIASNTTATFRLVAVGDNPLAVSSYYWVKE